MVGGADSSRDRGMQQRRPGRRFVSAYCRARIALRPGSGYRPLVLDADFRPVGPLNESYPLRAGVGASSTRETYLSVLKPFFGFVIPLEECFELGGSCEQDVRGQFDLGHAEAIVQIQAGPVCGAEVRRELSRPVPTTLLQQTWCEALGRGPQRRRVGNIQEGVVVFAKLHAFAREFLSQERVTIQVARDGEWQERSDA
jgi:hypothetical protein